MAGIEVSVGSHGQMKFHSDDHSAWVQVIQRLEWLYGPGALADAEGMQLLIDKTSHDIVPAGSYTWVKTKGEFRCACTLLLTSWGLICFEHLEYIV